MWTTRRSSRDRRPEPRFWRRSHRDRKSNLARVCAALAVGCVPWLSLPAAHARGADQGLLALPASSEFKLACSQSFEESQRLRNKSQYIAASDEILKCANPKCGEALFDECTKIYGELQTATPSVVFAAHDSAGNELTRVAVSIDGQESLSQLDGKPVRVDPGSHQFSFSSDGYSAVEQTLLIRAGEQFRPINVTLPQKAKAAAATAESSPPNVTASSSFEPPLASYVLGGVSVAALGTFAAFRLVGASQFKDLEQHCAPNCSQSEVDDVRQKYLVSDIALGIGAAAAVAAVTVYLVSSSAERSPRAALQLAPTAHGLSAHVGGTF